MGDVLDMITKKPRKFDCQGEQVVDLRQHFANGPDTPELSPRATEAAKALSVCVDLMRKEFGDKFAKNSLANEIWRIQFARK